MFYEQDIESAVSAGVLTPDAATAFRAHVAGERASPMVDEENFKLLTGFNDIFVAIAGTLLLVAVAWIGGAVAPPLGGALVAASSWGLAEYFTRIRRMALPSILFLLSFVGGVFAMVSTLLLGPDSGGPSDSVKALMIAIAAAVAAGAAFAHWRRFRVPITVAAGTSALAVLMASLFMSAVADGEKVILPLVLALGLAVFALAMRWDISDRFRKSGRSDVAFWLHLLAAPMIAHPVFAMLGLLEGGSNVGEALVVLALYIAMGIVALAIDRRALLVSALAYVLYAMGVLFKEFGAVSLNIALTGLVIGSALLLLSAGWQTIRAFVVGKLPSKWAEHLPPVHA